MNLGTFISRYDKPGQICLLEGKRAVKPDDIPKQEALGRLLAEKTSHLRFRSGNAKGADEYFSKGVAAVNPDRLEVISPYKTHRMKSQLTEQIYGMDGIDLVEEPEVVYHTKQNKKMGSLIDRYVEGNRDRIAMKAAYLLRDTVKVTGTSEIPPATVALFYDDVEKPKSGGTGHTMQVCEERGVPSFTQDVWMEFHNYNIVRIIS